MIYQCPYCKTTFPAAQAFKDHIAQDDYCREQIEKLLESLFCKEE